MIYALLWLLLIATGFLAGVLLREEEGWTAILVLSVVGGPLVAATGYGGLLLLIVCTLIPVVTRYDW